MTFHYTFTAESDGERIENLSTFGEVMSKNQVSCLYVPLFLCQPVNKSISWIEV